MVIIMLKTSKLKLILFSALVMALLSSCAAGDVADREPVLRQDTRVDFLGTVITLSGYDDIGQGVFDEAFALVADIDERMSANSQDNELAPISAKAGDGPVPVSHDTYALVQWAVEFSQMSGGAFDITVGPVMELWKLDGAFAVRPEEAAIKDRLPLVGYQNITLEEDGILLNLPEMKLDLGGIAKGYACDTVLDYLKRQNIHKALLDFGGNVYAHGTKPDGSAWKIGIRSPLIGDDEIACAVSVQDRAVVTSGGYERYFQEDGTTYHHILNPQTGYPAASGLLSVTIVDPSSTRADALSTACFVLGLEEGYALLESLPDSEGVFITEDKAIYLTSGLSGKVALLDPQFTITE
jgi:thiamine biosynthesis lipoprotein